MPIVKFVNEKKEVEVAEGTDIRTAALQAGLNIYDGINGFGAWFNQYLNCHGLGACGTCRVLVTKGMANTNGMTVREKLKFKNPIPLPDPLPAMAYVGNEDSMRLACMCSVHGDVEVETCPEVNLFGENFFS